MSSLCDISIYQEREAKEKKIEERQANEGKQDDSLNSEDVYSNDMEESSKSPSLRPCLNEISLLCLTTYKGRHFETLIKSEVSDKVFLASNNCEGNTWQGLISTALDFNSALEDKFVSNYDFLLGPISHLLLFPSDQSEKLVACFDSGTLLILDTEINILAKLQSNSNMFTDAKLSPSHRKCATSNKDLSITIFDLSNMMVERRYSPAHFQTSMGIDYHRNQENLLMSIGKDRIVLNWDLRKASPANRFTKLNNIPTAIKWSSDSDYTFLIGTKDGELILFDSRSPSKVLVNVSYIPKIVYKLRQIENEKRVAVCYDYNKLQIVAEDTLLNLYSSPALFNTNHLIRDCFKIDSKIYSLGLNSNQIMQHNV